MAKKPNIILFLTDDQRFDTIAALGNSEIRTPNLDKLVENGTAFTHAHIPSGPVAAICMPSRAMIHTGKTPFHLSNSGLEIPDEHVMLGETLQRAGYRTFGTGKWHNGSRAYARSFTDGAEIFFGGMDDHWNVPVHSFDPEGKYESRTRRSINCFLSNETTTHECDHVTPGKHSSELFCEAASNFIKDYNSNEPFFLYVAFMAPHDPRTMPEKFLNMYDPDKITLPPNYMLEHPIDFGIREVRDETLAAYPRTPDEVRRHIAEYYGMISHLDNELGKVLGALKDKGLEEDTIVVFAGDNGLALGQHGLMGKQNHYEHSIRIPLIFSGPGIPKNERRDTYVYLLDIYPTLCDMIGVDIPITVEGKSMKEAIEKEGINIRDTLYFAYSDAIRSVKDYRYKLIEYIADNMNVTQLFDLKNDTYETKDLHGDEKYKAIEEKLRGELNNYRDSWDELQNSIGRSYWERYEYFKELSEKSLKSKPKYNIFNQYN